MKKLAKLNVHSSIVHYMAQVPSPPRNWFLYREWLWLCCWFGLFLTWFGLYMFRALMVGHWHLRLGMYFWYFGICWDPRVEETFNRAVCFGELHPMKILRRKWSKYFFYLLWRRKNSSTMNMNINMNIRRV